MKIDIRRARADVPAIAPAAVHHSAVERLRIARARADAAVSDAAKAAGQVQRLTGRLHQVARTLEETTAGVLVGAATSEDIERLRAERGEVEGLLDVARLRFADVKRTEDSMRAGLEQLEAEAHAELQRARFTAIKSLIREMVPKVRELSRLNSELRDLSSAVGGFATLHPIHGLGDADVEGGGVAWHWLHDVENFDWASCGV